MTFVLFWFLPVCLCPIRFMSSTGINETTVGLTVHLQLRENISPFGASLTAQLVKNLPAMQETLVRFLGREDPLKNR